MLRCRCCYLLALAAAVLFYVFYTGAFSRYMLVLAVVFPFFSLAVSLPGMLGCALTVSADESAARRGETVCFVLDLVSRWRMPLSRVTAVLELKNLLTGETRRFREEFSGGTEETWQIRAWEGVHCGCVRARVTRLRVYDLLGLFSLRRPPAPAARTWVLPEVLPPEPVHALLPRQQTGQQLRPRPGGGPGEDYDLRSYRPGDPLRAVHWKLSSKLDDLVVRETLEPRQEAILLTFDHFGPPEALDAVLARLEAVSRFLLSREADHFVQWLEPETGLVRRHAVADGDGLLACLQAALATPAPAAGPSVLDAPLRVAGCDGPLRHLHLSPREAGEGGTA